MNIMGQRKISFLGLAKIIWTHTAVYANALILLFTSTMWYRTTGSDWMEAKLGWTMGVIPFTLIVLASIVIWGVFFVWKFEVGSTFGVQMDQQYKHSAEFRDDIQEILSCVKSESGGIVYRNGKWGVQRGIK